MRKFFIVFVIFASMFANEPPPLPNPPAQTCLGGITGLFITGDFIYWKARQDEMLNLAEIGINEVGSDRFINLKVKDLDFEYDPGWKLGLGWKLPFDGWDLYVNWTHLHNHSEHTFTSLSHTLIDVETLGNQSPPFFSSRVKIEYDLMFNSIDFDWGRRYSISKTWTVRPSFGLKTAWLHQNLSFNYKNPQTIPLPGLGVLPGSPQFTHVKNDYWGIGPSAAFEGKWTFGWGIGVYAKVSGAIFWGSFDQSSDSEENELSEGELIVNHSNQEANAHRVRPTIQMMVGLDWERCFIPESLSGRIRIGYETQFYFSQILSVRSVEESNVSLEGLTISARIDF